MSRAAPALAGPAPAPSVPAPRRHRCVKCSSDNVRRDVRRSWSERWLVRVRRPYYCFDCGARFHDRPLGEARGRVPIATRWCVATLAAATVAALGGGIMLQDVDLSIWTLGLNLLVVGLVAAVISVAGVWLTRKTR